MRLAFQRVILWVEKEGARFSLIVKRVLGKVGQNNFFQGRGEEGMSQFSLRQRKSNKGIVLKFIFQRGSNRGNSLFSIKQTDEKC